MSNIRMAITRGIKDKLNKYGVNLPTDKRTRAYNALLLKNNWTDTQYQSYLKEVIKKYTKKEKEVVRQVQANNFRQQVAEQVVARNKVRYVGSIFVDFLYTDIKNFALRKTKILPVDIKINPANIARAIRQIIDDEIQQILDGNDYKGNINDVKAESFDYDISPVNTGQNLNNIRMRQSGAGLIDGYEEQAWDTNTGRCVFDYIIHRYGNIKGFKNICSYGNLNKVFNDDDEEKDLLTLGVNTAEIERFCRLYRIPMYAIDDNEKCFQQFIPSTPNKKCPAMIFRLSSKHFYPVISRSKVQSVIQTTSIINNVDSVMVRETFKVDDKEPELIDAKYVDDITHKLSQVINDGQIPEKITMIKKELYGFKYGTDTFVSNENIDLIKKLCVSMKQEYSGQTLGTLLKKIVLEATGNEILPKSTHNPYVFQTLFNAKKNRAKTGWLNGIGDLSPEGLKPSGRDLIGLKAFDITKCYSSCMYSPSEEWIMIDYNDTWEDYDGELKLGIYYITTNDTMLFKKNGYYSTAIIKKGLQEGIDFQITKQLIAKHTEQKDLFTKIIDKVLVYSQGDTSVSKLVINLMSGLLGQSEKEGSKVKISNDTDQIFNFLDKYYGLEDGIMVNKIPDTDYFLYGFNKKITMNETNIPMYIQVLDESNIKLYDMIKYVLEGGGELVARKVDCAIVRNSVRADCDDSSWGGYRTCEVPKINRTEIIDNVLFTDDNDWTDYDNDDSDDWEKIMEVLEKQKGLLLQASAGNGKTYTAKQIANKLKERGAGVKILAPTNKAALNIGGTTIHKFLKMTKEGYISPKFLKAIKDKYQYIIVDEISMITKDLWKRLCLLKQETDIIFMLLGDNKQCPPVENEGIDNYFNHPAVKYICNHTRNELCVRKRYDEKLYNILENVDTIDTSKFPKLETQRNICYYNSTRIEINKYWNDKLKKEGDLFIPENTYDEYTQDMYIYAGMPIIAKQTKRDGEELLFANSETFVIGDIDDKYISVYNERPNENDVKEMYVYACPIEEFRDYFLMNYCSTTHKSQGETITENYTIYDWKYMCKKIKYTALSRAKTCEQVCFGYVAIERDTSTFVENIQKKLKAHTEYDTKKGYKNDITTDDIQELFVKQNSECCKCGCFMKSHGYSKGDKKQFSIDRIDSKKGHTKDNIQLFCWGCNRAKKNRF